MGERKIYCPEKGIIFMNSRVSDRDHDFCGPPVANEALSSCVEEWFSILWLGSCLEDLLVVENNGTITRWEVLPVFVICRVGIVL